MPGEAFLPNWRVYLELREAEMPWHSQRDGLVEMVGVLADITGSLAKFARDIALLMQTEVGEVRREAARDVAARQRCRISTIQWRARQLSLDTRGCRASL